VRKRTGSDSLKQAPFGKRGEYLAILKIADILVSPKSGEFRKNGTIRIFPGPIVVPIGFFTSKDKIRANTRNWMAKVLINQG
jgi:uncharacterized membrane protein